MTDNPGRVPAALCSGERLRSLLSDLPGKRVTLMGLGLFGGGEGAARFLSRRGAEVTVTDLRSAERLADPIRRLSTLPVRYRLEQHRKSDFTGADLVVANPAVPRNNSFLKAAEEAGVPLTSPMNLFLDLCTAPVAGVTGSNGKSTTTALLAAMLERSGRRVWTGGNIGVSLLGALPRVEEQDLVVLELSSFQLSDAGDLRWSPHVGVVTSLTPNHLSWHGGFDNYAAAKRHIVQFQSKADYAVLNARSEVLGDWAEQGLPGQVRFFDSSPDSARLRPGISLVEGRLVWKGERTEEVLCARTDIELPGFHNVENAMAAAAAARCLGTPAEAVRRVLRTFQGLAHRLEPVGHVEGVRFYDDSYSTTPESAVAALKSFPAPLVLVAGGYDKKLDLTPVARAAAESVEVLITLGQTGPLLARRTRRESLCSGRSVIIREAQSLQEAVRQALELSMPGTTVLFSPGCASYDMFNNYRQRGEEFQRLVRGHMEGQRRSKSA